MTFKLKNVRTGSTQTFSGKKILECLGDKINDNITIDGETYYISSYSEQGGTTADISPFLERIQQLEVQASDTTRMMTNLQSDFTQMRQTEFASIATKVAHLETTTTQTRSAVESLQNSSDYSDIKARMEQVEQTITAATEYDTRIGKLEDAAVNVIQHLTRVETKCDAISQSLNPKT